MAATAPALRRRGQGPGARRCRTRFEREPACASTRASAPSARCAKRCAPARRATCFVATDAMVAALQASGELRAGSARADRPRAAPRSRSGAARRRRRSTAPTRCRPRCSAPSAIYFPDATRSTAGIHFAAMLDRLGLRDALAPRLRMYRERRDRDARARRRREPGAIGCTQVDRDPLHAGPGAGRRAAGAVRACDRLQRRARRRVRAPALARGASSICSPARRAPALRRAGRIRRTRAVN